MKKTFIVGDIHGCFKEFLALLEKANYKAQTHRLILVGDIINRGPSSLKILNWVKKTGTEMVCGNHEHFFIKAIREKIPLNPIFKKLKTNMKEDLNDWLKFLSALPFYIEEKDFLVVHGGLVPGEHPQHSNPQLLMNIRTWDGKGEDIKKESNPAWYNYYKDSKLVVYGHWVKQGLKVRRNTIGLDTGCVYGHKLTGILLPERKIIQVPALKKYYCV